MSELFALPGNKSSGYLFLATSAVGQVLGACGAFAGYCRASLSVAQLRMAKNARVVTTGFLCSRFFNSTGDVAWENRHSSFGT